MVVVSSLLLWRVLSDAYSHLGFDVLGDEAFRAMVLARIVEPTCKADSLRVLEEIGAPAPGLRTLFRSLKRCQDQDYRGLLATACTAHAAATGLEALVTYDVTTLHFETGDEDTGPDALRKVGMSKEHRVDPQVQAGCWSTRPGSRLRSICPRGTPPRPPLCCRSCARSRPVTG